MQSNSFLLILCFLFLRSTQSLVSKSPSQDVLQQSLNEQLDYQLGPTPQFESPEHAAIGDQVVLRYPKLTTKGSDFNYTVKCERLSFGDIIALAGDFFYHWKIGPCAPSISNDWDTSPDTSLAVAADNVNLLRTDWEGFLKCILDVISDQRNEIRDASDKGKDVAQAYKDSDGKYNTKFFSCTRGYAVIALCNPDHFGKDAERAYSSVHTLALRKALEAYKSQKQSDLKEAYFIEGYAQHYLTDMFAAGHIRTPRRVLHSSGFDLDFMPGDQCCKLQHDEDGANGLWVTNREGRSWAVYGDKQLGQGRSAKNRQMVHEASQVSVDEIWETFESGNIPKASDYKALQKTPLPDKALGITNFVPLFENSPTDEDVMLFRQNVDQRAIAKSRQTFNIKQDNTGWTALKDKIGSSGASINMYIYTKAFTSDQNILHLGQFDTTSSNIVTDMYGTVDAGKFGGYWSMSSQGVTNMPASSQKRRWTDVQFLRDGTFSLVGRQFTSGTTTNAIHVGLQVSQTPSGQLKTNVVWKQIFDDGNSDLAAGETLYGSFDKDSKDRIMIKYFDGLNSDSRMEFWSLPSTLDAPPVKHDSQLSTSKLNFMISHKINKTDSFSTVVGYSSGPLSTSPGKWYFCSWKSGYKETAFTTLSETNARRAQALMSDPDSNRLIRIFYGKLYPNVKTIELDVLRPKRDQKNGTIVFDEKPSVQKFEITWHGLIEQDYLLWFVHDVNGDGYADLVAYTSDASNTFLDVVVFPSRADGTFDSPVVSSIELDPKIGQLLTGEFMRPLYTTQAAYTYPATGKRTSGAIMSFFDNYGIVGVRIIAPEASLGSFRYELKGQDSAIAGQRSLTVGERPEKWMGLNKRVQQVGIVSL